MHQGKRVGLNEIESGRIIKQGAAIILIKLPF